MQRDSLRRSRFFRAVAFTLAHVLVLSSLPLDASQGRSTGAPAVVNAARPAERLTEGEGAIPAAQPAPAPRGAGQPGRARRRGRTCGNEPGKLYRKEQVKPYHP